jgi:transcription initiation factor TFIIIB Brf1 subunit/transcription initiation factor TFIIB
MIGEKNQPLNTMTDDDFSPCLVDGQRCEPVDTGAETVCGKCGLVLGAAYDGRGPRVFADDSDHGASKQRADVTLAFFTCDDDEDGGPIGHTRVGRCRGNPSRAGVPSRKVLGQQQQEETARRTADEFLDALAGFAELMALSARIWLSAKDILRSFLAVREPRLVGRERDALCCAAIYLASRTEKTPRGLSEIARSTGVPRALIAAQFRCISSALPEIQTASEARPADANSLVARICERLGLPHAVASKAETICNRVQGLVEGRRPASVAAAVVFLVLQSMEEETSQRTDADVAAASLVTVKTMRRCSALLRDHVDALLATTAVPAASSALASSSLLLH